jgi:hypothetical protein
MWTRNAMLLGGGFNTGFFRYRWVDTGSPAFFPKWTKKKNRGRHMK